MSKEAETILRRLVGFSPLYAGEIAGDLYCFFCGEHSVTNEWMKAPHAENCPWVEARQFLNMPGSSRRKRR